MDHDPNKQRFSKPVLVDKPRTLEEASRDKLTSRDAFTAAQRNKDEAAKAQQSKDSGERRPLPPQKNHEMPGPGGAMVRNAVRIENTIRRAKALEAQKKADALEQDAKRQQAGKEAEMKRLGAGSPGRSNLSASEKQTSDGAKFARLAERVERLKLAEQARDLVKFKDEYQK